MKPSNKTGKKIQLWEFGFRRNLLKVADHENLVLVTSGYSCLAPGFSQSRDRGETKGADRLPERERQIVKR